MNESGLIQSRRKKVSLEDVVFRETGKIDINTTNYTRWVAGIHVDEGDLHVRRWGDIKDPLLPPTYEFTFKSGCILIHSRNPNKVAMPDFDGITGEKFFPIRSLDEDILRTDFLAFVLTSTQFREWVKKWLSGSVNKFLNWSALKRFEFQIPSLDEQQRITKILWAADDYIVKNEIFTQNIERTRQVLLREIFEKSNNDIPKGWQIIPLSECIVERNEMSRAPHKKDRYVGLENFQSGYNKLVNFEDSAKFLGACSVFENGDLLYGKLRPYLDKAAIAHFDGVCTSEVLVLNSNEKSSNDFLVNLLHSKKFVDFATHHSYGTKMPRTSLDLIGTYHFPLPSKVEQKKFVKIFNKFDQILDTTHENISAMKVLKMKLIDDLVSGGSN